MTTVPAKLDLPDREGMADAVYRAVNGLDIRDKALFRSAFTGDAVFEVNGNKHGSYSAIEAQIFEPISQMDTTHIISNIRADPSTGKVTATAIAQHYRPGEGLKPGSDRLLAGSLYEFDMVKEETWKIKQWILRLVWAEGDTSIVMPEKESV